MINTLHYTMRSTSLTGTLINQTTTYDVYYDAARGISYEVHLQAPREYSEELGHLGTEQEGTASVTPAPETPAQALTEAAIAPQELVTWWHGRVVNDLAQKRLEYDLRKRIYYQTRQTINVERALYNLQEDLQKFMAANPRPVAPMEVAGVSHPGYELYTLTIWVDQARMLPIRRINRDRGFVIIDDFIYHAVNTPLPEAVFLLPKPAEAIADFDLYPEAPTLPRFEIVPDANRPQYGVWVETLIEEVKRHVILNQWEYGPFATIDLPWLVEMPVTIYRRTTTEAFPPLIVAVDAPLMRTTYFLVTYDFLGYVVAGFTNDEYDLSKYERLPITAAMELRDLVPLYQAPSFEKRFVVENFVTSVQSNDFFINAFNMDGKVFDLIVKNFSFHENEGYLLLNVYGKEYWDNANLEAMFNYIVTGRLVDAHTTPIQVYAINTIKRLGIYEPVMMPVYEEIPAGEPGIPIAPPIVPGTTEGAPTQVPTPLFESQGTE